MACDSFRERVLDEMCASTDLGNPQGRLEEAEQQGNSDEEERIRRAITSALKTALPTASVDPSLVGAFRRCSSSAKAWAASFQRPSAISGTKSATEEPGMPSRISATQTTTDDYLAAGFFYKCSDFENPQSSTTDLATLTGLDIGADGA